MTQTNDIRGLADRLRWIKGQPQSFKLADEIWKALPQIVASLDQATFSAELVKVAEATKEAHESMFAQCCSNPITNAWGKEVNVGVLNDANWLAGNVLDAIKAASALTGKD